MLFLEAFPEGIALQVFQASQRLSEVVEEAVTPRQVGLEALVEVTEETTLIQLAGLEPQVRVAMVETLFRPPTVQVVVEELGGLDPKPLRE